MHFSVVDRVVRSAVALTAATLILTFRPTMAVPLCVGDCNENGEVSSADLMTMVNVALDNDDLSTCQMGDAGNDAAIRVDEVIAAVNNAANACGMATPTHTPGGSPSYVGDYYGAASFYGVRFHVDADGSADGFFDFLSSGSLVAAARWRPADIIASYPASGDANLTTGTYHLTGDVFGTPFDVTGQLPADTHASGALHIAFAGTTADGTLSAGTPPPGPTPTPPPGCDSASLQMNFSAVSGNFNGISSNFVVERMNTAVEQKAPDFIAGFHEVYNSTFNGTECAPQGQRLRNIQLLTFEVPGGLMAGQALPIALSSTGEPIAVVFYGEEGSGGDRVWTASSGMVFIDAVNGSVVTLRVAGAAMTETAGAATGSFTLDVSGQVNNFSRQE